MFTRIKRAIRGKSSTEKPIYIDGEKVIIQSESIEQDVDETNYNNLADVYIPKRKVTKLEWNGPKLHLQGFFYLQGLDMRKDDFVKKELILISNNKESFRITLRDISLDQLNISDNISDMYQWAGFDGIINFSTFHDNQKPISAGEYTIFIEVQVEEIGLGKFKKVFSLGNIEHFLPEGFHSSKMEYFSAKRELKYNLMANYDFTNKTLKITSTKLKDVDPTELGLVDKEKNDFWYRLVKNKIFKLAYVIFCLLPLKSRKVLFASDSREEMSGNFHFVYQEMKKQNLDLDYRFALRKSVDKKKSTLDILSLAYNLATSKYIFLDDFYPMIYKLRIRGNAELVQLWHAVGAFKTFGFSRIGRPGGPSPKSKNHRNYTVVTVSSSNIINHYAEGFGIDNSNVVATGVPRTDVFFDEDYKMKTRDRLYEDFPFLRGKKVITFAPTFRGNGQQSAHYNLEALNLDMLYKELKDDYVFLFKLHPFVKNDLNIPYVYSDFFYDFSEYREINDLLFITDLLITDYSSVCFEFALLDKPMIFFAYDVEDYVRARDFYYDYLSFIPGPLVKNTDTLIKTIKTENFKMEKIKPFTDYFFDDVDGKASERVVNYLFNGSL